MKLSVKERILLDRLYVQKGSMSEQIIMRDIKKKVDFTQSEIKEFNIVSKGNRITWDKENTKCIEIDFSQAELELLKTQVTELDNKKEITDEILDVCIKIKNAEVKS